MFPYRTYLYCPEYPRQKQWPRWRGIATEDDGGVPALPEEDLAITSSTVAGVKARFWCSLSRLQAAYASASLGRNEAHGVISSCKIILDTSRFIVEPDSRR